MAYAGEETIWLLQCTEWAGDLGWNIGRLSCVKYVIFKPDSLKQRLTREQIYIKYVQLLCLLLCSKCVRF